MVLSVILPWCVWYGIGDLKCLDRAHRKANRELGKVMTGWADWVYFCLTLGYRMSSLTFTGGMESIYWIGAMISYLRSLERATGDSGLHGGWAQDPKQRLGLVSGGFVWKRKMDLESTIGHQPPL